MRLYVQTDDLRQALQAVAPHAADPRDDVPVLARVRCVATPENLFVMATNRYTMGIAAVSVWDHDGMTGSAQDDAFDLTGVQVKELLTLFHAAKQDDAGKGDLQIEVRPAGRDELVVTDISGLFPGKALTMPGADADQGFPNLARLVEQTMSAGRAFSGILATNGRLLRLFGSAAQAYGMPLTLEPTSRAKGSILVACGESFRGVLMPIGMDDDTLSDHAEWTARWGTWLEDLAAGMSEPPQAEEAAA